MKNIKYIIKRIIIGVGIALVLSFLRGSFLIGVSAKEVSSYNWGTNQFTPLVSTPSVDFTLTSDSSLANQNGDILFSFSIYNNNQNKVPIVNNVRVYSGTSSFVCNFGTVNNSSSGSYNPTTNQTTNGQTAISYSVVCPVNLGSDGLTRVGVFFLPWGQSSQEIMTITFSPYFSFIKDNDSTQDIIENVNDNTEQQIESQKVCTIYDLTQATFISTNLDANGLPFSSSNFNTSDFISISSNDSLSSLSIRTNNPRFCFYNINKFLVSCDSVTTANSPITIPSNASYFRYVVSNKENLPTYKLCKNGNQAIADSQQQINDTLNDSNVDSSSSEGSSFFEDFSDPHGATLSDIISLPLDFVNSLNNQCQPITLPIPHFGDITLPCIKSYISQFVSSGLINLISLVVNGFLVYRIVSSIIDFINQLKDPNNDDLEVMDL